MQYRGFNSLHARMLLAQQFDIGLLEQELDAIDRWEGEGGSATGLLSMKRDSRHRHKEDMPADFPFRRPRPQVLVEIKQRLLEYGKQEE